MKPWSEMTPRERDIAIAERVLHIPVLVYAESKHPHQGDHAWLDDPANYPHITDDGERLSYWQDVDRDGVAWSPSTDYTTARLVEDEIERRGFQRTYTFALGVVLLPTDEKGYYIKKTPIDSAWSLIRATPDQRCEAAWRACGGAG